MPAGVRYSISTPGGLMASAAEALPPPEAAPIFAVVAVATCVVVTLKVAEVDRAGTVKVAGSGTWALALSLLSVSARPASGAGMSSVTVATAVSPPASDAGASETPITAGGVRVSAAEASVSL